jgi:hypothetical protein
MKVAALYLWGIRSLVDYFNNLYLYDFKVRGYAFLDQGVAIAVFGFALLAVAAEGRRAKQAAYLAAGVATAMLLSLSKSGIFSLILPFYFLARIFSPATLRAWTRAPVLLAAALLFMIGLGVKTQVKYRGLNLVSMSPETVWDIASATVEARFSSSGLYRKYSNLVNRIIDDPTRALGGEATVGVFANVIPSFVWQGVFGSEKPPHPFYARGELVNEDFHVDLYANDAPSLVGASFIDAGFLSLIPTMLFGGLFLGLLRVLWLPPDRHVVGILGYVFFASQFGPASAESGFLNVFYFLAWGVLLSVLLWIVLAVHERLMMAGTQQVLTPAAGD